MKSVNTFWQITSCKKVQKQVEGLVRLAQSEKKEKQDQEQHSYSKERSLTRYSRQNKTKILVSDIKQVPLDLVTLSHENNWVTGVSNIKIPYSRKNKVGLIQN